MLAGHVSSCWLSALGASMLYNRESIVCNTPTPLAKVQCVPPQHTPPTTPRTYHWLKKNSHTVGNRIQLPLNSLVVFIFITFMCLGTYNLFWWTVLLQISSTINYIVLKQKNLPKQEYKVCFLFKKFPSPTKKYSQQNKLFHKLFFSLTFYLK